jgi:hypothetical protein
MLSFTFAFSPTEKKANLRPDPTTREMRGTLITVVANRTYWKNHEELKLTEVEYEQ